MSAMVLQCTSYVLIHLRNSFCLYASVRAKLDFTDKVVIITGASSGIGAETAKHFSDLNAKMVITDRNEEGLLKTSSCMQNPIALVGDLLDEAFVQSIALQTIEKFGRIDILVNNAGILEYGNIENTSLEQYDNVMNTNVRSIYQLTSLVVPHLIETKGNIVNVSSLAGHRAIPNILSYCMSKAALDQFTRCVALELAGKGVRVNAVNPGMVITNVLLRAGMNAAQYEEHVEKSKKLHPLGRPGNVDEIAKVITFLASDNASFITATTFPVDGGRQARCP